LTSNAVSFYRGPEEGFSWLFTSEYAGVDLEERDSDGWTLLCDAAFNFGWWTKLCIDDIPLSWQSLYLLRAGVNPHAPTTEGSLTPLDAFLRGCTTHQVDHARKWLEVLRQAGINITKYAAKEQQLHGAEHILKVSWDVELWKWIPTKRRVVYGYDALLGNLQIWLEDYDALSWFQCGRYDLDIFQYCTTDQSALRWKQINYNNDSYEIFQQEELDNPPQPLIYPTTFGVTQLVWTAVLVLSLALNYILLMKKM
jgi:hypothetical protein